MENKVINAERTRNRRTAVQAIKDYLLGNLSELTNKEKDILERLRFIQLHQVTASEGVMIEEYCAKYGVSEHTAHQDMLTSMQLFGSLSQKTIEGKRFLWHQRLEELYMKAYAQGDYATAAKIAATIPKLLGNPDKENFAPDMEVLGNNLFIVAADKRLQNGMIQLIEGIKHTGQIDFSKFPVQDAEIIDEILNEEDAEEQD